RRMTNEPSSRCTADRSSSTATGIGWIRLQADDARWTAAVDELRSAVQRDDGSLVILRTPGGPTEGHSGLRTADSWDDADDAFPLMRALKDQFDPKGTLNPGRFVGGI